MESIYIFYGLLAIVLLLYGRKALQKRSLKSYSPAQLEELQKETRGYLLVDVRTNKEHRHQQIPGSIHIPLHELAGRLTELEKHRQREIICCCQTGNRSVAAAILLRKNGFTVANLKGGLAEWNFYHRPKDQ